MITKIAIVVGVAIVMCTLMVPVSIIETWYHQSQLDKEYPSVLKEYNNPKSGFKP